MILSEKTHGAVEERKPRVMRPGVDWESKISNGIEGIRMNRHGFDCIQTAWRVEPGLFGFGSGDEVELVGSQGVWGAGFGTWQNVNCGYIHIGAKVNHDGVGECIVFIGLPVG